MGAVVVAICGPVPGPGSLAAPPFMIRFSRVATLTQRPDNGGLCVARQLSMAFAPVSPSRRMLAPPSLSRLLRLAGPIVTAQMAFFGIQTTDTIIAGRMGAEVLAAIALGGTFLMMGFTFLIGFALAVAPGVSHRFGAGASEGEIGRYASSSMVLCVVLWTLWGAALWVLPEPLLIWLDIAPSMVAECSAYLRAISLGAPFLGVFFALRNVMEALGHSRPIMWLGLLMLLLNIPLDLLLMYGAGPIPALGATGCGLATAIIDVLLAASMLYCFWRLPQFRGYRPQGRPRRTEVRETVVLGLPIALALASEHAIFAIGGFLMARFGAEVMGASQIALNFTGMVFMIALGLGQATAVLVGQAAGARDGPAVRKAGSLGFASCAVLAGMLALLLLWLPETIVRLYTREAAVAAHAVMFLKVAGIFHLFDALQALGAGALRGLKDTRYVMQATTVAYWGVGGTSFWYFFIRQESAPVAVWYIYLAALGAAAVLLGLRFWWQARHFETKYA